MRGATIIPLFSILISQTVNCTRVENKADMGLILPTITYHQRAKVGYYPVAF